MLFQNEIVFRFWNDVARLFMYACLPQKFACVNDWYQVSSNDQIWLRLTEFSKMFTSPIGEKLPFFTNICLQSNLKSLKSSKLPICDIFSSLLCLVHVVSPIFKDRVLTSLFSGSRMFTFSITNSIAIG